LLTKTPDLHDFAWVLAPNPSNRLIGFNGMKIRYVGTNNQSIRMRWMGLSKTPFNRKKPLEGFAVGLFVRYRRVNCMYSGYSVG